MAEIKPVSLDVWVPINGQFIRITSSTEKLDEVTGMLQSAMADRAAAKPGYFCNFNTAAPKGDGGAWAACIWSTSIDGYYITEQRPPKDTNERALAATERHTRAVEKFLGLAADEFRDYSETEKWKRGEEEGGDDAD